MAVSKVATPWGDRPGTCMHVWCLGGLTCGPGARTEVCPLLWVGVLEMTPWSLGMGLEEVEHQGEPPMQQSHGDRAQGEWGVARGGRSWGNCSVDCFFSV